MTRALAALARHAAAMGEQPAVVFVDERGHWRWRSWSWLAAAVAARGAELAGGDAATAAAPDDDGWMPSLAGLTDALARQAADPAPWDAPAVERALDALSRPLAAGERPVVAAPTDLRRAEERAWLTWALECGGALVLPGDAAFLAWAIYWPRATDAAVAAEELPPLRELLAGMGRPRAVRRQLARLQRLVVWDGTPAAAELAAWGALGVTLVQLPPLDALGPDR